MKKHDYADLAVLSTLDKPMTLTEMGYLWFNDKTKFYKPHVKKQLSYGVKVGWLINCGPNQYKANFPLILDSVLLNTNFGDSEAIRKHYVRWFKRFYINHGHYTKKVFLNPHTITTLMRWEPAIATNLHITYAFHMPLLLMASEQHNRKLHSMFVEMLDLRGYLNTVKDEQEKHAHLLKEEGQETEYKQCIKTLIRLMPKLQKKNLTGDDHETRN